MIVNIDNSIQNINEMSTLKMVLEIIALKDAKIFELEQKLNKNVGVCE